MKSAIFDAIEITEHCIVNRNLTASPQVVKLKVRNCYCSFFELLVYRFERFFRSFVLPVDKLLRSNVSGFMVIRFPKRADGHIERARK